MPLTPKIENARSLCTPKNSDPVHSSRRPDTNKHSSIALQNKEVKKKLNESVRTDYIYPIYKYLRNNLVFDTYTYNKNIFLKTDLLI